MSPPNQELDRLSTEFKQKLPSYLIHIKLSWEKLLFVNWDEQELNKLVVFCHKLRGSSGTYGYHSISEGLKKIEHELSAIGNSNDAVAALHKESISRIIEELQSVLIVPDEKNQLTIPESTNLLQTRVAIIDDDKDTAEWIEQHLLKQGAKVQSFLTIKSAIDKLSDYSPDLVILDSQFPEGRLAGIDAINDIRIASGFRVPIVLCSGQTDMQARLKAANNGCDAYVTKPINPNELFNAINNIISLKPMSEYKVLIVEDDRSMALYYNALLKKLGVETKYVQNPLESIRIIETFHPDLVLLDNVMPECSGVDLLKLIRQDPKLRRTHIVMISADNQSNIGELTFDLGVLGFLKKPVKPDVFVQKIKSFLTQANERQLKVQQITKRAEFGGVSIPYFFSMAEKALENKLGLKVGIVLAVVENFEQLVAKKGRYSSSQILEKISHRFAEIASDGTFCVFGKNGFLMLYQHLELESLFQQIQAKVVLMSEASKKIRPDISIRIALASADGGVATLDELIEDCEVLVAKNFQGESSLSIAPHRTEHEEGTTFNIAEANVIKKLMASKSFSLLYQPIMSLSEDTGFCFNSYFRLSTEDGKYISPSKVFSVIKDKENINAIDRFVLNEVVAKVSKVDAKDIFLFVKMSDVVLHAKDSLLWVSNVFKTNRLISNNRIVFEIDEESIVLGWSSLSYFIKGIKALGCGLAINDFCSTKRGKEILTTFAPNWVKIKEERLNHDKSILSLVLENQREGKVNLILTEVEDAEALSKMYSLGIKYFQGYFIGKPQPEIHFDNTRIEL